MMTREQRLEEAEKEITASHKERERWIDYTIDLQRIIEALCDRRGLPEPLSTARHHYNMAKEFLTRAALTAGEEAGRVKVPEGQTPLDDNLDHPLLGAFYAGGISRDTGVSSPYHGHSLEHCLHAIGWVQRDLMLALREAREPTPSLIVDDAIVERAENAYWHEVHHGSGYGEEAWRAALNAALSGAREGGANLPEPDIPEQLAEETDAAYWQALYESGGDTIVSIHAALHLFLSKFGIAPRHSPDTRQREENDDRS